MSGPRSASRTLACLCLLAGAWGCARKAPVISSFTGTPSTSRAGSPVTLSWQVTDAVKLSIDQGVGDVTGKTSVIVSPTDTVTYTLDAAAPGVSVTKQYTQTVVPKVPPSRILSFTATPVQIAPGAPATLAWSLAGQPQVTLDHGVMVPDGATQVTVTPAATTTYTLSVQAPTDPAPISAQAQVIVTPLPTIGSFGVAAGDTATGHARGAALGLVWVSDGDTFTLGDGATTIELGTLRETTVHPLADTLYTLTATGPTGAVAATLQVTVSGALGQALVYTDPPHGSEVARLVLDPASTATALVLDLVAAQTMSALGGVALDLPLDGSVAGSRDGLYRVALDDGPAAALPAGLVTLAAGLDVNTTALPAWAGQGSPSAAHPAAAMAALPSSGPLTGILALGAAWKPSLACLDHSANCLGTSSGPGTASAGDTLLRVRLKLVPAGGTGPVFTGASGTGFRAELRDGTLGAQSAFAIGALVVQ